MDSHNTKSDGICDLCKQGQVELKPVEVEDGKLAFLCKKCAELQISLASAQVLKGVRFGV